MYTVQRQDRVRDHFCSFYTTSGGKLSRQRIVMRLKSTLTAYEPKLCVSVLVGAEPWSQSTFRDLWSTSESEVGTGFHLQMTLVLLSRHAMEHKRSLCKIFSLGSVHPVQNFCLRKGRLSETVHHTGVTQKRHKLRQSLWFR